MDFSEQLNLNGLTYLCEFQRIFTPAYTKAFIIIKMNRNILCSFEMKLLDEQRWCLVPPAPKWVRELERQLSAILQKDAEVHAAD